MTELLTTEGLSVSFGGVRALADVSLEVPEGQLVGLIGPNGAGKTTFIDAVTGFVPATGRVALRKQDLSSLPAHERARSGMARTWQLGELFDDLTVRENLTVAAGARSVRATLKEILTGRHAARPAVDEALELLGLLPLSGRPPGELTEGQRKLVGVARALAARPHVLLLDEPAAGLDTAESEALGRRLRAVVDAGTSMLLIDHDMGLVLSVCDTIVVLEYGKVIACGTPAQIRNDPRVVSAYLGDASTAISAGADVSEGDGTHDGAGA